MTHAQPAPAAAVPDPVQSSLAVLSNVRAAPEARLAAAKRLVAVRSPQSRDAVVQLLRDSRNQTAVAQALADNPDPDLSFVDPLFQMLQLPGSTGLAAAQALGTYKAGDNHERVLQELVNYARGGAGVHESARANATLALGQMVDRAAAETLVNLLTAPDASREVQDNATKALAALSGNTHIGADPQGWQNWWAQNQNKTPAQFRDDMLSAQSDQLAALKRQYSDLESAFALNLDETYHSIPADQRDRRADKLQQFLTSANPITRAEGARIIVDDKQNGIPLPPMDTVQQTLRGMIADPDPRVRLAVAQAIVVINDRTALKPLIDQLSQESDPAVKAELAKALGQIADVQALSTLLPLLDDSHDVVVTAAARALERLGPQLQNIPHDQEQRAATQLRIDFERSTPGTQLREAVLGAMASLRDPSLLQKFKDVLNDQNESAQAKIRAINGIANLKDERSADEIGRVLRNEQDAGIRAAAAEALPAVNGISSARTLVDILVGPDDPGVQAKSWDSFQSFMPSLDNADLQAYADRFSKNKLWDKSVKCLMQIRDNLIKSGDKDQGQRNDLALAHQNLANAMMQGDNPDYDGAAAEFDAAIAVRLNDYQPKSAVMTPLYRGRLQATLAAGKYSDAVDFAQNAINNGGLDNRDAGALIKDQVEQLRNAGGQNPVLLGNSIKLIDESARLDLPDTIRGTLNQLKSDINKDIDRSKGSGFTTPGRTRIEAILGATARRD
jgi:HEAT repeat protein